MKNQKGSNNPAYLHGHCTRDGQSSEYMTWSQMIQRCENKNNSAYENYGGRGIKVCDRWHEFSNFFSDMGCRTNGLTLDRIDNAKGYSLENCKWVSRSENNKNKRNNLWFSLGGVRMTLKDWSKKSAVSYRALHKRIGRGWDFKTALETPSKSK